MARTLEMTEEQRRRQVLTEAMQDIVHFDRLCQTKLGMQSAHSDHIMDWTEITLEDQEQDPKLLRKLAERQQLRLVYEPDDFLQLLSWSRLEAIKYRDSARFRREFTRLIQINGGLSRHKPCNLNFGELCKVQKAWMKVVRSVGRTTKSNMFPSDNRKLVEIPEPIKAEITKMLDVGDFQTQLRFLSIGRFYTDTDPKERFSRQILKYFSPPDVQQNLVAATDRTFRLSDVSRVACSLTVTLLELHGPFQKLFDGLGLQFNAETGLLQGQFTGQSLEDTRWSLVESLKAIHRLQIKADPARREPNLDPDYEGGRQKSTFFLKLNFALASALKFIGLAVEKVSTSRKNPVYQISPKAAKLRYAMAGFHCDTFEDLGREDALVYFADNYISAQSLGTNDH